MKDIKLIFSDNELLTKATELTGLELVQHAPEIGDLGQAMDILDIAKGYRNTWKAHGGHIKPSDAARLDAELQQPLRDLYELTASTFRHLQLVRPGVAEITGETYKFQIEKLSGSDPMFERQEVELDRPVVSNALAFWFACSRTMSAALPFFRLGAPQEPQETSFYVFNRVESGGFRWVSYQEAREQEFVAPDEELFKIIALRRRRSA